MSLTSFLPVEEFQLRYAPAYYSSWAEAEMNLSNLPIDREIIEQLTIDAANGVLRNPVRVQDETEFGPMLSDGMHRVIACKRAGVSVPFTNQPDPDYEALCIAIACQTAQPLDADPDLYDHLRSLRLSDETWIVGDSMAGRPEQGAYFYRIWYGLRKAKRTQELVDLAISEVAHRLRAIGFAYYSIAVDDSEENRV